MLRHLGGDVGMVRPALLDLAGINPVQWCDCIAGSDRIGGIEQYHRTRSSMIKTQTIVAQTELDAAVPTLGFGAEHAFKEFGVDDGKGNRVFDTAIWQRIIHSYTGKAPAPAPVAYTAPTPWQPDKAAEIIAARHTACFGGVDGAGKCDFNVDGLCQHPACKTCPGKQRNAGALEAFIKQPFSQCPINKWNFKL
jgi:hypothetical protein